MDVSSLFSFLNFCTLGCALVMIFWKSIILKGINSSLNVVKPDKSEKNTTKNKNISRINKKVPKRISSDFVSSKKSMNSDFDEGKFPVITRKEDRKRSLTSSGSSDYWNRDVETRSRSPSDSENTVAGEAAAEPTVQRRNKKSKRKKAHASTWDDGEPKIAPKVAPNLDFYKRIKKFKASESDLHEILLPYCLSVEDRILSGYPYETDLGVYVYKRSGYCRIDSVLGEHKLVDAEIRALKRDDDFTEQWYESFAQESNGFDRSYVNYPNFDRGNNVQKCARCYQHFSVFNNGMTLCFYHPMKANLTATGEVRHACCNMLKSDSGCYVSYFHVFHHLSPGVNGPLKNYAATKPAQRPPKLYGIDCEMIFTTLGFEVARATLINIRGSPVLDIYILPVGRIIDLNTQFSGITLDHFKNAYQFSQAREMILQRIATNDILVGHSLESDLDVLKIIHRRVIDTSLLFVPAEGKSFGAAKRPLKTLVKERLGKDIQQSCLGHDSREDAKAALHLALSKISSKSWGALKQKPDKVAPLPAVLMAFMN